MKYLKAPPPDLTLIAKRNGGTFPDTKIADLIDGRQPKNAGHGTSDMPIWGASAQRKSWEAGATRPARSSSRRLEAARADVDHPVLVLDGSFDQQEACGLHQRAVLAGTGPARRRRSTVPVSSSSVRNRKPFAVPGRWRTITAPAARAPSAVGHAAQLGGGEHAARAQLTRGDDDMRCAPVVRPVPR